jgi:hypothetical protein
MREYRNAGMEDNAGMRECMNKEKKEKIKK